MIQKGAAALAVLALVSLTSPIAGQANQPAQVRPPGSPIISAPRPATPVAQTRPAIPSGIQSAPAPNPTAPPARSDCPGGNCDAQLPHISIATPAPAPAPWPWQERVAWGANLVLVILGYAGILMALALLRKIDRQARFTEESVHVAAQSASAALKLSEALQRAERPWILMSVRPSPNIENGFTVVAMNRGRSPARIISTVNETVCTLDETHLESTPVYKEKTTEPTDTIILLPDETTELVSFSRADVKQVCGTYERMKRVEDWEEKIYLYGKVTYRNLAAPEDSPAHESSWFCWYIHGRQKSGMVMAGPQAYNRHT